MIRKCPTCPMYYDDEYRLTLCPHDAFPANDGANNFAVHEDAYLSAGAPAGLARPPTDQAALLLDLAAALGLSCEQSTESVLRKAFDKIVEAEVLLEEINVPEIHDFANGVVTEAMHQRARWGTDHDAGKTDADWFWLIGYLAGKALHNPAGTGELQGEDLRLHRIVATAAACANWHAARSGTYTRMRPGIEGPSDA